MRSLATLARERPDHPGWVWVAADGSTSTWTFAEASGKVGGVVAGLADRGARPGDRIAVVGGNHPAWVLLREAASAGGWVFVPVGSRLTPHERDWILRNAEVALRLGDPGLPAGGLGVEDWSWTLDAEPTELPAAPPATAAAQLLYTSGSAGRPKGVLRPRHGDEARIRQSIETFGVREDDVHLVAGPLYHSGPAIFHAIHRAAGATQWVLRTFDAGRVADLVTDGPVTSLFMVPTMWRMVIEEFRSRSDRPRLLRAWTAGSHMDPDTRHELLDLVGEGVLWEFYGTTETGTVTVLPPDRQRSHADSVGFPAGVVRIRILDDGGADLPVGEVGRVFVESPTLMTDYHRGPGGDPALEANRHGDALTVGDLGSLREDGSLSLLGREGGMIVTGGVNVYPEEVEAELRQVPGVREAVVVGLPDPLWGSAIAALVEPAGDARLVAEGLDAALRDRLAGYKIPKRWAIGAIPRTLSEKVIRDPETLAPLFEG